MNKDSRQPKSARGMDRRTFLRWSGILGVGAASTALIPLGAEAIRFNRSLVKVSRTRLAMGTFVSMTALDPSRDKAEEAMGKAFEEVDRLTRILSRFDTTSAVAQLNREGTLKDVPPEVVEVISRSLHYYRLSRGYFDVTVKPVVDLFRARCLRGTWQPPTDEELAGVLDLVGADGLSIQAGSIRFRRPGMGITLDGVAKGYIVDRASSVLSQAGIANHLVNAGGDIRTRGARPDRRPWAIAIQDPDKQGHFPDTIRLNDGAVATSGDYEAYFDREKMFPHIVDPRTGLSPHQSRSVSVTAPTAMEADALSTAVFVMGPARGVSFVEGLRQRACLIVDRGNRTIRSTGWRSASI